MASPLGHALLGAGMAALCRRAAPLPTPRLLLLGAFAGIAPDLDVLAGIPVGDLNAYHQGISHSITFAALFGLVAGMLGRSVALGVGLGLAYASHLLLDLVTFDGRPPYGIPLLWPLTDSPYQAPFILLHGVRHGVPGDPLPRVLMEFFSLHNLRTAVREFLLTTPVAVTLYLLPSLLRKTQR